MFSRLSLPRPAMAWSTQKKKSQSQQKWKKKGAKKKTNELMFGSSFRFSFSLDSFVFGSRGEIIYNHDCCWLELQYQHLDYAQWWTCEKCTNHSNRLKTTETRLQGPMQRNQNHFWKWILPSPPSFYPSFLSFYMFFKCIFPHHIQDGFLWPATTWWNIKPEQDDFGSKASPERRRSSKEKAKNWKALNPPSTAEKDEAEKGNGFDELGWIHSSLLRGLYLDSHKLFSISLQRTLLMIRLNVSFVSSLQVDSTPKKPVKSPLVG